MSNPGRMPWVLCGLLFLATALSFLDRQVLSVLAPTIMSEFAMTSQTYSHVVFAFMLSYTAMFALGGYLVDRFGTRRGLMLSLGLWSIASGAHSLVVGPVSLGVARFFLGLGEGACFPASTKGATEWFPLEKRVLAIGIANNGSAFGAVLAPPLIVAITNSFGWRGAFLATSIMGGLWLLAWSTVFRVVPEPVQKMANGAQPKDFPIRELLRDHLVRRVVATRFLVDQVFYFYMFWIPQYLTWERGFSLEDVGGRYWIPFFVVGLSGILAGRLSDTLVRRGWKPRRARVVLLSVAACMTPASWLVALAPTASAAIALMSVLMTAHGLWQTNFLGLLSDSFPSGKLATVVGLSGTGGGIGGMLSSLVVGAVVDRISFTPVFAASGVVYPLALAVLLARPRTLLPRMFHNASGSANHVEHRP